MTHRHRSQYALVRAISESELPLANNVVELDAWRARDANDDARRARIRARKKLRKPWTYVEQPVVRATCTIPTAHKGYVA